MIVLAFSTESVLLYLVMDDELHNSTYTDRLLVPSALLSIPNFHLDLERLCLEPSHDTNLE